MLSGKSRIKTKKNRKIQKLHIKQKNKHLSRAEKKLKRENNIVSLTCVILLAHSPVSYIVNLLFAYVYGEGFAYDTIFIQLITYLFVGISILIVFNRIKIDMLFMLFFFCASFMITYALYPKTRVYMFTEYNDILFNPLYIFFFLTLTGYFLARTITEFDQIYKYMTIYSYVLLAMSIYGYSIFIGSEIELQYMVFSYNMLIPTVFLIIIGIDKGKSLNLIVGLMGGFLILISGARGPIVCLALSILTYIFFTKMSQMKKIAIVGSLFIAGGISAIFFTSIIKGLIVFTDNLGVSSRTLTLILEGGFLNDSGRSGIIHLLKESINLFGNGLFSDRIIALGYYAHNIFYEIIVEYGIILGTVLIIYIFILVLAGVKSLDSQRKNLIIILMTTGIFKLMLSGSYLLQEPAFYIVLGLAFSELSARQRALYKNRNLSQHIIPTRHT